MKTLKFLLWGGLTVAVLMGGYSSVQAVQMFNRLEYELHPQFSGLDSTGLLIDLDASYRNDTSGRVAVRDLRIDVFHDDSLVAVVDLSGQRLEVKPHSRGRLSDPDLLGAALRVRIPLKVIEDKAPGAIGSYLGLGPALILNIQVRGHLAIPWVIPFGFSTSHTHQLGLKP